jgi:hypothetical protein
MKRRRYTLLVLLAVSACSSEAPEVNGLVESIRLSNCGLPPAITSYLRRRSSAAASVRSGGPIRACGLPTAEDIALACASREAVPIPGSQNPDNPDAPSYSYPAYKVRAPSCGFADGGETMADCAFELLPGEGAPIRVRTRLTFRFRDLSNSLAHNYFSVGWEVDGSCLPRRVRRAGSAARP